MPFVERLPKFHCPIEDILVRLRGNYFLSIVYRQEDENGDWDADNVLESELCCCDGFLMIQSPDL